MHEMSTAIECSATKDNKSQTPLNLAVYYRHEAVVKLLINTGKADLNSKDSYGQTPLWWAAKQRHEPVVKLLVSTGKMDVNSKD